jgi:hypothetical protein
VTIGVDDHRNAFRKAVNHLHGATN